MNINCHPQNQTDPTSNLQKPWFQFDGNKSCGVRFLFSLSRVLTDSSQSLNSDMQVADHYVARNVKECQWEWYIVGIEGVYLYCQGSGPILSSILETLKNNF